MGSRTPGQCRNSPPNLPELLFLNSKASEFSSWEKANKSYWRRKASNYPENKIEKLLDIVYQIF